MKILITSDLHYRLKQFDWLVNQAGDYDAIIIAGDLLDIGSYLDLDVQITVIKKYLIKIAAQTPVLVCSGNHDGNTKNQANEFVAPWLQEAKQDNLYVDGDDVRFGDILISIFPWWDGEVTKAEVIEQFKKSNLLDRNQWIWIYHAPPDQSPTSWQGKRFIGDNDLNIWIDQYHPDLVFCGHIHESPFKRGGSWVDHIDKTYIFNAGSYIGDIPAHIVLDSEVNTAYWHSLAGDEQQVLC